MQKKIHLLKGLYQFNRTVIIFLFFALQISVATAFSAAIDLRKLQRPGPVDPAHLGPVGLQLQFNPANQFSTDSLGPVETKLKSLTDAGARALAWLNLVNKNRAPEQRLVLADRNTKNPVPPNAPKVNSINLMLKGFQERVASLPPEMKTILINAGPASESTLVADELFIKHIREINSSYQNAIRWIGQQPWLDYYERNAQYDIRGLYFINRDESFFSDLSDFASRSAERKYILSQWLVGICLNTTGDRSACQAEFSRVASTASANNYYEKYISTAKATYANFFKLNNVRKELKWNSQGTVMVQDFILPSITSIAKWLKTNVEEEWNALNFQLLVNYVSLDLTTPYIDFQPGVTPNVSGTTWNKLTMDPNYSLDDFSTQWTIRHEFGHVLGFPDCYLEFYEPVTEEMIYYTIEPENLMCAWGGILQPSHINELKRVY